MRVKEMLGWLASPHTFEVAALFAAGIGVALALSAERGDVSKAQYCFSVAFLLTCGRIAQLLLNWHETPVNKYIAAFLLFALIVVSWIAVYKWVDGKLAQQPAQPQRAPLTAEESATIVEPKVKDWLVRAKIPFQDVPVNFYDGTRSPFGIAITLPIGFLARIYIQPEFPEVLQLRALILLTPEQSKIWNRLNKEQVAKLRNNLGFELKRAGIVSAPVDPPGVAVGQQGISVINNLPTSDLTEYTFGKAMNELNDKSVVAFKIRDDEIKKYAKR